jgi:hypothetical protein
MSGHVAVQAYAVHDENNIDHDSDTNTHSQVSKPLTVQGEQVHQEDGYDVHDPYSGLTPTQVTRIIRMCIAFAVCTIVAIVIGVAVTYRRH